MFTNSLRSFVRFSFVTFFAALVAIGCGDPCASERPDGSPYPGCEERVDVTATPTATPGDEATPTPAEASPTPVVETPTPEQDSPTPDDESPTPPPATPTPDESPTPEPTPDPIEAFESFAQHGDAGRVLNWGLIEAGEPFEWRDQIRPDVDQIVFDVSSDGDILKPFKASTVWGDWCKADGPTYGPYAVPADLEQPTDDPSNRIVALLLPNNSIIEVNGYMDCGDYVGGWVLPVASGGNPVSVLSGECFSWDGGHGGAHLPAVCGTIRVSELMSGDPIPHYLNIQLDHSYYYWSEDQPHCWPGRSADSYAEEYYTGENPDLGIGCVLAIPDSFDCDVEMETHVGWQICTAMQVHGAITVDDAWVEDEFVFGVEYGVLQYVQAEYGIDMSYPSANSAYYRDVKKMRGALVPPNLTDPDVQWPRPDGFTPSASRSVAKQVPGWDAWQASRRATSRP